MDLNRLHARVLAHCRDYCPALIVRARSGELELNHIAHLLAPNELIARDRQERAQKGEVAGIGYIRCEFNREILIARRRRGIRDSARDERYSN
jgi:hypothetical protein